MRKLSFVADTVADTGGKAGFLPRGGQLAAGGAVAESPMHCPQERSPACGRPLVPCAPDPWAGSGLGSATDSGRGTGSVFAHEGALVTFFCSR